MDSKHDWLSLMILIKYICTTCINSYLYSFKHWGWINRKGLQYRVFVKKLPLCTTQFQFKLCFLTTRKTLWEMKIRPAAKCCFFFYFGVAHQNKWNCKQSRAKYRRKEGTGESQRVWEVSAKLRSSSYPLSRFTCGQCQCQALTHTCAAWWV